MTDLCSIPGCGQEATFSLPLKRKNGEWATTPICRRCRAALAREARAAGKTIQFYGLEGSKREAEKRNAETLSFKPFLAAFATTKPKVEKPKAKVVAIR
jgi:hypothetical protein